MKILKEHLDVLWYEDSEGNKLPADQNECIIPEGSVYQVSRFPRLLRTSYLQLTNQEEVNSCKHPRGHVVSTAGWIDGVVGRKCKLCGGTQIKNSKLWIPWPRKWNGEGSREVFTRTSTWSADLVLAITNSGDYVLLEAITIAAICCERCMNALAEKYGLKWGYPEYSADWHKCNTVCQFCK